MQTPHCTRNRATTTQVKQIKANDNGNPLGLEMHGTTPLGARRAHMAPLALAA